jgi:ribosome-binding protein aMBF1 (putative translation factor)
MVIIDLIREIMFQEEKTIRQLALETGLDYSVVEDIVLRDITPTPKDAKIMLRALGIDLEEVLCLF